MVFLLLEKKDTPSTRSKKPFVVLNAKNNVYKAWGPFLGDPLYQWVRETNARQLQLNQHVSYIHSKFLLRDPLGADPIVVTGSANFSVASTTGNDENMLVIRGNRRVADIYFTEFNRLFNHYYFCSVVEDTKRTGHQDKDGLFLIEDDSWAEEIQARKPEAEARRHCSPGWRGSDVSLGDRSPWISRWSDFYWLPCAWWQPRTSHAEAEYKAMLATTPTSRRPLASA